LNGEIAELNDTKAELKQTQDILLGVGITAAIVLLAEVIATGIMMVMLIVQGILISVADIPLFKF